MKILVLFLFVALAACGPSEAQLATAIAETQAAMPTEAPIPTVTPIPPTATSAPTSTSIPKATEARQSFEVVSEAQDEFRRITTEALEGLDDVDSVSLVRLGSGKLEVELRTRWSARDNQPDVSYVVTKFMTGIVETMDLQSLAAITEGDNFPFVLVTYSVDGDYRYQSESSYELLERLLDRSISYDEWVQEANADFR